MVNNDVLSQTDTREKVFLDGMSIDVYIYQPSHCKTYNKLFIFHGQKRNAAEYINHAKSFANTYCLKLLAPEFRHNEFKNWQYQRGGIKKNSIMIPEQLWTVKLVQKLVDWSRKKDNNFHKDYYLFGHSAGAQFLSRVAALTPPSNIRRFIIANPSSYMMASLAEKAPYGLGGIYSSDKEAKLQLQQYLSLPLTIYLGGQDTGNKSLHNHQAAKLQGSNRLERGMNVFKKAEEIAKKNNWIFNWSLVIAPDIGHSANGMLNSEKVLQAFNFQTKN